MTQPVLIYGQFERVLREPALVVEGRLEAPLEERREGKVGVYRSVLSERIWSMDALLSSPAPVHGARGLPGESPRAGR